MKKLSCVLLLSLLTCIAYAQSNFKLSGTIKDNRNQELLVGATIYSQTAKKGTQTDATGSFTLVLPKGKHKIIVSFIGYKNITQEIDLQQNTTLNFEVEADATQLTEVEVTGEAPTAKVDAVQTSINTLTSKEAKLLPALFGETDLIKILQLKPGVQSGGEGNSGLYVRGGGADQNLVLLDGAVIYNPNHLFGFFSVFNSDAVDKIDLYKGDFPAQFGGRLSSVLDVKLRGSQATHLQGTGGIGLISSRLALEFPIYFKQKSKKINVILSARRTYFDVFTRGINALNENTPNYDPIPSYYFHDLTAKINYDIDDKNKVYFSGYYGRDAFEFKQRFTVNLDWGNAASTIGWQRQWSPRLTSNTAVLYSHYDYIIRNEFDNFKIRLSSGIENISLKSDWNYQWKSNYLINFGAVYTAHEFTLGQFSGGNGEDLNINRGTVLPAGEFGAYMSHEYTISPRLAVIYGLRATGFINKPNTFWGIEPRVSARYKLTEKTALKASLSQTYQYQHLISSSGASLPSDLWYPSNATVKPERATQGVLGISFSLWDDQIFLSNEVYYKDMTNQIDIKDGAQLVANDNLDNELVFGKGWAYGNEIYIEKRKGKTRGWIGYTHAYAWRQFDALNGGSPFHPRYDRRNDVSVVVTHELSPRVIISFTWVYGTGNAVSLPTGRFYLQDLVNRPPLIIPTYNERNSFRMADYHRFDASLVWKFKPKWGESDLTFSIYNVYNRRNAFFLFFEPIENKQTRLPDGFLAKQVSLFPIIPSVTYNFKF